MKATPVVLGILGLLAGSLLAADSDGKGDIKSATKKLADAGGYSWKTTVNFGDAGGGGGGGGRFRPGPTEGRMGKDGTILLSMTRPGRDGGETTTEAVLKGDKGAVKTQDGWKSLAELTEGDGGGGQRNPGAFLARTVKNLKQPSAEAEDLLGKTKDVKKGEGSYSGDLTEEGAKSLLTFGGGRGGQNAPQVSEPKGTVKFWIKDGVLTKYQYQVQGKMTFGDNERDVKRTTTVEIKDIGSTKIEVSEEAKKKLS